MRADHVGEPVQLFGSRLGVAARPIDSGDGLAQPMPRRRQRVGRRISSGKGKRVERSHGVMGLWQNRQIMPHAVSDTRRLHIIGAQQGADNRGYRLHDEVKNRRSTLGPPPTSLQRSLPRLVTIRNIDSRQVRA